MTRDPALPPDPAGGWSESIRQFDDALIVPAAQGGGVVQSCGLLNSDGGFIRRGVVWRREVPLNTRPAHPGRDIGKREGRWLWGGVLFGHFGHFLMESTSRLWAVPKLRGEIDGVIFATRNPTDPCTLKTYQRDLLGLLIGDCPAVVISEPARVSTLLVPGQGFGLGPIAAGTGTYRAFIETEFARNIAPEGPARLFVSRSTQTIRRGGFVGEAILDARMAAAGYEVFHPEMHDIATQIARYRAAEQTVAIDGSALHLYAMVARSPQRVAMILRRQRGRAGGLIRHLQSFMGDRPLVIDAFSGDSNSIGRKGLITDLDLAGIGDTLRAEGFVDAQMPWGNLTREERRYFELEAGLAGLRDAGKG